MPSEPRTGSLGRRGKVSRVKLNERVVSILENNNFVLLSNGIVIKEILKILKNILIKEPFERLDAYTEEAYIWAQEIYQKIDTSDFNEKDIFFISLAFAYIFGGFIYVSIRYVEPGSRFEDYLIDCFFEKEINFDSWDRMHNCRNEIYSAMTKFYGRDPLPIYRTLYDAILINGEDEWWEPIKIEPYDFDDISAFSFVMEGFLY